MKLAFLWYWGRAEEIFPKWRDGLCAAIEEIGKTHDVDIYLGEREPDEDYDAILFWGDSNCAFFDKLQNHKGKKGIILTTDPHNIENLKKLDVVFCESTPVYEAVRQYGLRAIKAFGTDTDFYSPNHLINKDMEFFYPATFSPWKRQSNIAYLGDKLTCIGTVQPDGVEELEVCRKKGVNTEIGYFPPEKIRDYYQRTREVIIPAIHGSERTVLEAMACDIFPKVTHPQNVRTRSYIEEFNKSGFFTPREFVLANYSHYKYAKDILKGFE